jgi:hypothetical protein
MNEEQEVLHNVLATRGVKRVFKLQEYGPEQEQDLALIEHNGAEGYWISNDVTIQGVLGLK